ncbi:hypothetical protein OG937_45290 [Streptomyces sp. NBC_00510]
MTMGPVAVPDGDSAPGRHGRCHDRACRPASSPPLSHSLTKPVQHLEAQPDEDFGTIPKPDHELAAELVDRAASR